MELNIFTALTQVIKYNMPQLADVRAWNNQLERSNGVGHEGRKENAFNYPIVFLEFDAFNFENYSMQVQRFKLHTKTHLAVKSFETDDMSVFQMKEQLFSIMQGFQFTGDYFTRLVRIEEQKNYNHDDVTEFITTYECGGKDDAADWRLGLPSGSITGTTFNITGGTQ
jgi:hypothetical protein